LLQHYTEYQPNLVNVWYAPGAPWNTILTTAAPFNVVVPQLVTAQDLETHIPDFLIEVREVSSTALLTLRTVLVVKIRHKRMQLLRATAFEKVYWSCKHRLHS